MSNKSYLSHLSNLSNLEKDREDETEGQLFFQRNDREPEHRRQEQREEPEESAEKEKKNLCSILGNRSSCKLTIKPNLTWPNLT